MSKHSGRRRACVAVIATAVLVVAAPAAWADPAVPAPVDLSVIVVRIRLWILGLASGVAAMFLVYGGIRYIMAGGDPGSVERAKLTIKNTLLGYAVALLAPVFLTVVRQFVA